MKARRTILLTLSAAAILSHAAFGCTILPKPKIASSSFVVQLRGNTAARGIQLRLHGDRATRIAATDPSGRAEFPNMPPGEYTLQGPGIWAWEQVEVRAGGSAIIEVDWPQMQLLITRLVRGRFTDGVEPITPHDIVLKDAQTGKAIGESTTSATGNFSFAVLRDGIYVLEVKGRTASDDIEGPILIQVDSKSSLDNLDIQVGASSCGLSYSAGCTSKLNLPPMSRLSGRVTDLSGAVITDAEVLVISQSDVPIARVKTDSDGRFDIPKLSDGTYSLRIVRPAFLAFQTALTIQKSKDGGELQLALGLLGGCHNIAEFRARH